MEPQSIIHQVMRLEKKIVKSIYIMRKGKTGVTHRTKRFDSVLLHKESDHTRETHSTMDEIPIRHETCIIVSREESNDKDDDDDAYYNDDEETSSFYSDAKTLLSKPRTTVTKPVICETDMERTETEYYCGNCPIIVVDNHSSIQEKEEEEEIDDEPSLLCSNVDRLSTMDNKEGIPLRRDRSSSVDSDIFQTTHDTGYYSVETMYESSYGEGESITSSFSSDSSESSESSFDSAEYNDDNNNNEDDDKNEECYRTINQNQFFGECFGTSDRIFVHFFNPDTKELCEQIDNELSILASKYAGLAKFIRINGRLAPFFTTKLRVTTLPSIVAIGNGGEVDGLVENSF